MAHAKKLKFLPALLLSVVAILIIAVGQTLGQEMPTNLTKEDLANNNKLWLM
jgi:hypothetical protein